MAGKEATRRQDAVISAQDQMDDAPSTTGWQTYMKLPEGVKRFKPTTDHDRIMRLIFLPWHPGKNHPRKGQAWVTGFYFKVHKGVGPNNESFLCPGMFGHPCPICEAFQSLRVKVVRGDKQGWDAIKEMRPKDRELFLLHDLDGDPKNIQVWDESIKLFGDYFRERLNFMPSYMLYASLNEKGRIIRIKGREKKIDANSITEYATIDLAEREGPLPEWLVKAAEKYKPDEWVYETAYDKLRQYLRQTGGPSKQDAGSNGEPVVEERPAGGEIREKGPEESSPSVDEEPLVEDEETPADEDTTPPFKEGDEVLFVAKGEQKAGEVVSADEDTVTIKSGKQKFKGKKEKVSHKPNEEDPTPADDEDEIEEVLED